MAFGRVSGVGALAMLFCSGCASQADAAGYPLLDEGCREYATLGADTVALPDHMTLNVFQDESYVWLCASLPPESYGAADIVIDAPGLDAPRNLHISAQLGEWPAEGEGGGPETAESDQWWRVSGWSAIPFRFNGYQGEGDERRAKFIPSEARELQLSKAHFGRGVWNLRLEFNLVRLPNGDLGTVTFPEETAVSFDVEVK